MSCDPRCCEMDSSLDDDESFSFVSTTLDIETVHTPSEISHETDDFAELFPPEEAEEEDDWTSELFSCGESTSISPSVFDDETAHGRRYHGYKKGLYPLPNDRQEQQREELNHAMMLEVTGGHLFYADIGDHLRKIIDIGTGTGSWAIDMADLYPSANVVGTDLSAIQPRWVPVNVRMFVDDCEQADWLHDSGYDLVHFRNMVGVLRDPDGVLAKAFPRIKNGGWIEFQEVIPQILCDDGSMSDEDPLRAFYDAAAEGLRTFGCDPLRGAHLEEMLDRAGFTNIRCVTKKMPISTWEPGSQLKTLGLFMTAVMHDSLDALAAKPLAALGISAADRRELTRLARESLEDRSSHRYVNCCFCYAQKSGQFMSGSESYC